MAVGGVISGILGMNLPSSMYDDENKDKYFGWAAAGIVLICLLISAVLLSFLRCDWGGGLQAMGAVSSYPSV